MLCLLQIQPAIIILIRAWSIIFRSAVSDTEFIISEHSETFSDEKRAIMAKCYIFSTFQTHQLLSFSLRL